MSNREEFQFCFNKYIVSVMFSIYGTFCTSRGSTLLPAKYEVMVLTVHRVLTIGQYYNLIRQDNDYMKYLPLICIDLIV